MNEANDWLIRIGEQEYRAPDLDTVKQWCADGRVPMTALIYHPSLSDWRTAAQLVGQPASTTPRKRSALYLVVLVPVLMIGSCVACTVGVGTVTLMQESAVKKKLPDEFRRAEAELHANHFKAARARYESLVSMLDSTTLITEKAKAKAGLATALALAGDEAKAQATFVEALRLRESVEPASNAGVVMSAFYAARNEVEQQTADRKEKTKAREMKSRLEGTARRYIEHEAGDGEVEITSVGDPYLNGGYWAVQVYYVKDDHRGRRAKVTVVLFSPLNYEVVGSRDVI
jgi:hypothetical protein